jgi:phosphatidylglycerol---prolipoprotein diacylglyceryl transferase
MRKILFSWYGLNIRSYPAMLYLGLVAGVFAGAHVAQLSGMNPNSFAVAIVVLIVPALVGARLLFVLTHWDIFRRDLPRIWRRSEGGMAMYGGLIVTVPLSIPLLRALHLPFAQFWDAATVTILLGMVFTRIGCLLNGCCAGRPTSAWLGLTLPDHRGVWRRRVPSQLLEMLWAAILLAAALAMRDRTPFPGAIFCSAVIAYGAARLVLEPLRDGAGGRGSAVMQATSILLIIAALIAITVSWSA